MHSRLLQLLALCVLSSVFVGAAGCGGNGSSRKDPARRGDAAERGDAASESDAALTSQEAGTDVREDGGSRAEDASGRPEPVAPTANGEGAANGTAGATGNAGAGAMGPNPRRDAAVAAEDDASVDDDAGVTECAEPNLGGLALETLISGQGLATLGSAAQAPGSSDWYLIEQRGRIVILREGALLPQPFLDVQPEIVIGQGYEDRGLISLAFAPDYATSGLAYVVLTPTTGADANRDLVLEYRRDPANPDVLDVTSRKKIVEIVGSVSTNFLRNIHNGGRAAFGPDGFLYVSMGDGGGVACNDVEPDEPQDIGSGFGKILRLDPTRDAPHAARGNPFARDGDPRVYHYGLRNPYSFSFDRRTGDLYIGDVGQNSYEEIDVAPSGSAGLNFGWAAFEGVTNTCPRRALRAQASHTPPIFVADRRTTGCSGQFCDYRAIVGGVVYRGPSLPALDGVYLFGDYVGQRMAAMRRCDGVSSELRTIRKRCDVAFAEEACFQAPADALELSALAGIVEGNDGEIYFVANRDSLLKVVPRQAP